MLLKESKGNQLSDLRGNIVFPKIQEITFLCL